jgi:TonB family protein
MFQLPKSEDGSKRLSVLASFLLHGTVLYFLLHRAPEFVKPSAVAWGRHGANPSVVYLAPHSERKPAKAPPLHFRAKAKAIAEPAPDSLKAGSENGSAFQGLADGRNAIPALPQVFPDPLIYPWQLSGVNGDVVVEVTIDEQGSVTETRLLQSLKQEIDEKVIATVRTWRFKPATVDGVAISSRQDVHFHFPS